MFPEDALFEYVLADLAEEVAAHVAPAARPMNCDLGIARNALQAACRRGAVEMALEALATLFVHDLRAVWRCLTVIAVEDVGVADIDVLARVVASTRNRAWRTDAGGDWMVASLLVRQMCESHQCRAVRGLLVSALNDPGLEALRDGAREADMTALAAIVSDLTQPIELRAIAVLAIGGGLANGQMHRDPCAVFDLMADGCYASHVVATSRAAWRISRKEVALLLPLLWQEWMITVATREGDG